jgi:hypothetical protein
MEQVIALVLPQRPKKFTVHALLRNRLNNAEDGL